MLTYQQQLQQDIADALKTMTSEPVEVAISHPEIESYGDYSTNVALQLAKTLKKNPLQIATELVIALEEKKLPYIEQIETVAPGFINFWLKTDALEAVVSEVLEDKDSFGTSADKNGMVVVTEFTDPNPFKEFHIGHLYSNIVGESVSRLFESQGATVNRVNYQGDVGLHVAKAVWGIFQKIKDQKSDIKDIDEESLEEKAKFLGQSYALGAKAYEEDEQAKAEIIDLNRKIFARDPQIMPIYEKGKQWSLEYFETLYHRLGTSFKKLYFESMVADKGLEIVRENMTKGIFEESEGAVIFPGEKYGLHNRVFINSLGLPTYEAKELGLAPTKYEDFKYDQSVIITGNEINEYFRVLLTALKMIRPDLEEKTLHLSHGMVRLPEGKMSSRTGNVVTGEWLLNEAHKKAWMKIQEVTKTKFENDYVEYSSEARIKPSEQWGVAEKVGVGAVKYALLKNSIGKDVEFSFDESIRFEGNAGPYIQYTYVRTRSILEKVKSQKSKVKSDWKMNEEERNVLRALVYYPEIVSHAAEDFSPSHITTYLFELAQKFNLFYQMHKVVGSEQEEFRLALTQATGQVLKNGLNLLGIQTVERM